MKLLLINKNPVVSRMMHMSVPKAGFEIEEVESIYDLPTGHFDVVVIDDDMYDENFMHDIQQNIKYYQIGLITSSKNVDTNNFDFILTKPFLPTDLIEVLRNVKNKIEGQKETMPLYKEEKEESPFDQFLEPKEESKSIFDESERIVEVEEREEESPFIPQEEVDRSGILDEMEVQKVSELLQTQPTQEHEPLQPERELSVEPKIAEEENLPQEEATPESILAAPLQESESEVQEKESLLEEFMEPHRTVEKPQSLEDAEMLAEEVEPQEELERVQKSVAQMSVANLRKLLDGMQLDITIKISYPDRKDV